MKLIREINENIVLDSAEKVYKYLEEFKNEDREFFIVIGLDTQNKPCYREIVSIGTLDAGFAEPREVFKKAIVMSVKSIIIAHNHPSGNAKPSKQDIIVTNQLVKAGKILGIQVLDHIIIGKKYYSLGKNDQI